MRIEGNMELAQASSEISIPLSEVVSIKKFKIILLLIFGIVSVGLPLILLLFYRAYATKEGIILESGCHGPELSFGMFSGILMALQLRYNASYS